MKIDLNTLEANEKKIVIFMIQMSLVTMAANWFHGKELKPLLEQKFGLTTEE